MKRLATIFARLTEGVAALMMAAMFATFLIQIAVRYVAGSEWFIARLGHLVDPVHFGWTLEFCLVMWLWIVFWGNAFVVRDQDHVTFDILYAMTPDKPRRIMATVSALAVGIALAVSFWPTWDYIDFLKIKKSATLKIPMRTIFSIYAVFLIAIVLRSLWTVVSVWRHGAPIHGPLDDEGRDT